MKTINLIGTVGWEIDSEEFAEELDNTQGDVAFEMNSGGGYVTDGIYILNKIRAYDRGKTIAKVSYAASMMTQLALACDEVQVYDNAIFMIHNVQGGEYGDHNDMREQADLQERMSDMLANMYVQKTGKTLEEIKEMMDNDTYLFGQEIVDEGFADEVIETNSEIEKENAVNQAKEMMKIAQKAMKKENLSLTQMKKNFEQCQGNCNMGGNAAIPTASGDKLATNSKTGVSMAKFDRENLDATEAQFNSLVESKKHLNQNIGLLNDSIKLKDETVENLTASLATANGKLEDMVSKDDMSKQLQAKVEVVCARVEEAFATDVTDKETILAMVAESDDTKAHQIALDAKEKTEALHGENKEKADDALLLYAQNCMKGKK